MNVQKLTKDIFTSTIQEETKPVIVCFSATWCGPCKILAPVLDELATEREDIAFYKVDTGENFEISEQFSVKSIPTLISFKNGEVYKRCVGVQSKQNIVEMID